MQIHTLATQPGPLRALRRSIVGVGGAGVAAVVLATFGGGLMDTAASAALSGGGSYGPGAASPAASSATASDPGSDAVAGMAAAAPVQLDALEAEPIVTSSLQGAVGETPAAPPAPAVIVKASVPRVEAPRPEPGPPPAPGTVQAVIHEVFGAHGDAAVGVARCESGLNPNAISRGGGNWGLFQINKVHRGRVERMGFQWNDLLDARVNALVAKSIFDEQGWGPWACRHAAR
jgi:soluble lytic murein transglycosylase-like protein